MILDKHRLKLKILNSIGKKDKKRKILIVESDDWGGIRIPNKTTKDLLIQLGDNMNADSFLKYDSLESYFDVKSLENVLLKHVDSNNRNPIITANFVMKNPLFNKDYFEEFKYELFTETYKNKIYLDDKVFEIIKKMIKNQLIFPQLHCLQHISKNRWENDVRDGVQWTKTAYSYHMIGTYNSFTQTNKFGYMDTYNQNFATQSELLDEICEAQSLFTSIFGFPSKSLVPSCYVWNDKLNSHLNKCGISILQMGNFELKQSPKNKKYSRKIRYTFQKNKGIIYTTRNCELDLFTKSTLKEKEIMLQNCINDVKLAFKCGKPAIVNFHRANISSRLSKQNMEENLMLLDKFFEILEREFSDLEYSTSVKLVGEMSDEK